MSVAVALDALDLAALLCSRVCHDLISPAGAIVNGLEVLEEEDSDEETKTFALDLIKRSAKTASARLQFCRLAFGSAGAPGGKIDIGDAEAMARPFIENDKTKLGIYELDGDTYKFCLAPAGKPRPTEFTSKEGSGHSLGVSKREKLKDPPAR